VIVDNYCLLKKVIVVNLQSPKKGKNKTLNTILSTS